MLEWILIHNGYAICCGNSKAAVIAQAKWRRLSDDWEVLHAPTETRKPGDVDELTGVVHK